MKVKMTKLESTNKQIESTFRNVNYKYQPVKFRKNIASYKTSDNCGRKEVKDLIERVMSSSFGKGIEEFKYKYYQTIPQTLSYGNIVLNGNARLFIIRKLFNKNHFK